MTQDEIIEMAIENTINGLNFNEEGLVRFANLVAAKEREACAKVCETLWNTPTNGMATEEEAYGDECAAAIRARGQA
jgi:hypothetical protein